jgi:formylglycine-generating enzyme required for sulfatase activity
VFTPPAHAVSLDDYSQWWSYVAGANWRHPDGPSSDLKGRQKFPVVHVAYEDAAAYAKWAGKRLPTEAEFEFAARGGLEGKKYVWGDDFRPLGLVGPGRRDALTAAASELYADCRNSVSPTPMDCDVGGMSGSGARTVPPDYYRTFTDPDTAAANPVGPQSSFDPEEAGAAKRVTRGGSFLCSGEYCSRYLVGSRGKAEVSRGSSNLGFRLVKSAE